MNKLDKELSQELEALRTEGLYRSMQTVEGAQGPELEIDGKSYLCFCSNNYLGLASHPEVVEAAISAARRYGWGTGASRLISGTMTLHERLEAELAEFKNAEAAILFPTGYMANLGVIGALIRKGDTVIVDKLDHASIIDACRLSGAFLRVYPHMDTQKLGKILKGCGGGRTLIVTDSLFSMDGDLAPLADIVSLARRYGALVMVDEAHATGVLGPNGRGGAELCGVEDGVDISMGTLSKALGGSGGFVAGSAVLVGYLRNRARSFIYTTAPPPAACAAALCALRIVRRRPELRERLARNAERLRRGLNGLGFDTMGSAHQIIPVLVGEAKRALNLSRELFRRGILAPAIRPPTVPKGASRIRLSVMATHTEREIDRLLQAFCEIRDNDRACLQEQGEIRQQ